MLTRRREFVFKFDEKIGKGKYFKQLLQSFSLVSGLKAIWALSLIKIMHFQTDCYKLTNM